MKKLEFIMNTIDPKRHYDLDYKVARYEGETTISAVNRNIARCKLFIIGRPHADEKGTVEQLEDEGYIGLYREVDEE